VPITKLEVSDFRNYSTFILQAHPRLTVLVGANGTGKTNIIEALQLMTAATSFRRPRWEEVVHWGAEAARIHVEARDGTVLADISLQVTPRGRRAYRVNGDPKRRVSDVAGTIPSVTFTPDDLGLVKGSAEARRSALDDLGEQLSKAYGAVRRDYMRVVRQRNALLKEARYTQSALKPWDEQLVSLGARLLVHRVRLFARLARHATRIYEELAPGERLSMHYHDEAGLGASASEQEVTHNLAETALRHHLTERAEAERARRTTIVGPHRDDVECEIDGRDARAFASQGQQRTTALAWKLAEVRVIEEIAGREPVLLLDDVMSELDEGRRGALLATVNRDVQTFVTTTNLGYFPDDVLAGAKVVTLP
jgi:DNA replication and repair protein RecF